MAHDQTHSQHLIAIQQSNTEVVATDIPLLVRNLKWMTRNIQQSDTGPTHDIIILQRFLRLLLKPS